MNSPKSPPEITELWQKYGADRSGFFELMELAPAARDDRYPHWDKLVHLQPPAELSHEEWWFLLKMARKATQKPVPLLIDKRGEGFTYNLADPIAGILHEIDMRAGGRIEMPAQVTNPDTKDQYFVESLIEEAITSSQLEGATTTRRAAEQLIRSGRRPGTRSETMIYNNYLTMRRITELQKERLTPELIFRIHELVTRDTFDDPLEAGRFRYGHEDIVVGDHRGHVFHRPPDAAELPERMEAMCRFANGEPEEVFMHPVLRSIALHFWLGYDHPFTDGNGRCARALFYWSMLHHGYWLCEFISISQILVQAPSQYGRSFLYTESDANDLTYFILYHVDVIRRAIEALHGFIARRTRQLRALELRVRNLEVLNHRQRALLSHAVRHPGHAYTITTHKTSHNIVYETARTDLLDLRDRGLLSARKRGRAWSFVAPRDLAERLSAEDVPE